MNEGEDVQADWAELMMNHGDALIGLAELEADLPRALDAVAMLGKARTAISVRGSTRSAERAQLFYCKAMLIAERLGAPPYASGEAGA